MSRVSALLVMVVAAGAVASARGGILDLLWGQESGSVDAAAGERGEAPVEETPTATNCSCAGSQCDCCAALDFSYIDLGGPGCVSMRYVSPSEGIALNISYGQSLLLSDSVKGSRPPALCLDLLSDLAQLCARVGRLAPAADGLRWCVWLEPRLLGDPSAEYALGCFRMGPHGMTQDDQHDNDTHSASPPPPTQPPPPESDLNEDALIAAVNQSAEDGIAFFSNLLGLTFGGAQGPDNATTEAPEAVAEAVSPTAPEAPSTDSPEVEQSRS